MPSSPRPLDGLVWPLVPNSKKEGDRSTTWANKQALAAAIGAVDPALAERVLGERQWRQKYTKYVYKHVEACLQSKKAALASSKAGLEWVHSNFEFVRGGKSMKLADAMTSIAGSFETGFLKGSKPKPTETVLEVCFDACGFCVLLTELGDQLEDATLVRIFSRRIHPRCWCFRCVRVCEEMAKETKTRG